MLYPLLPARLHGWLDELASVSYLAAAFVFGFSGIGFAVLMAACLVHFTNTRLTDYPRGHLKKYPLRVHAAIELGEGALVFASAFVVAALTGVQVTVLCVLGGAQVGAGLLADVRMPRR